ncbi:MAG: transposase, partial [Pseudoxanthomonas sp.]
MPRRARLVLPNQPLHVTQRGVNRAAIFIDDEDRHHYRRLLREACAEHGVALHAFVLMDNHVHLLLTPRTVAALALAMRVSGQSYVQAFNARHRRSGTLWQGRYNSCLVDSDRYLLTVCRYIELNPVRAAMVAQPQDYRWSSVHTHLGTACDPLITPHPLYLALGSTMGMRAEAYRQWLEAGVSQEELVDIRRYIAQQRAYGDHRFQAMVEKTLNRTAVYRPGGRP